MKAPVSAYRAEAIGPCGRSQLHARYFFYVGGAFRWIDEGVFSAMSVTKISTRLPYISSLEAQMLLLQSTPLSRRAAGEKRRHLQHGHARRHH